MDAEVAALEAEAARLKAEIAAETAAEEQPVQQSQKQPVRAQ